MPKGFTFNNLDHPARCIKGRKVQDVFYLHAITMVSSGFKHLKAIVHQRRKKRKTGEPELEISLADMFRAHVKMAEGAAVVELPENREGERKCLEGVVKGGAWSVRGIQVMMRDM